MIKRETGPDLINLVSNMPGVREFICYKSDAMNWAPAFEEGDDIIILSDGDGACGVFARTAPRTYQVHTIFGPNVRGRQAIETASGMLDFMRPFASVIWGATPVENCKARWFNRQLGAMPKRREIYEAEGEVEIFELRLI